MLRAIASFGFIAGLAVGIATVAGGAARAQKGPPIHIRGTITAATRGTITVETRAGPSVRLVLPDMLRVSGIAKASFAQIGKGTYVGVAAVPLPDGRLRAQEVLIFPPRLRGVGEGHRPWDLTPGSTMTNANVDSVVGAVDGRMLTLGYRGGTKRVMVPPGVPIVTIVKGDRKLLKPGAKIFAVVRKAADGRYEATRIAVGIGGEAPPM